MRPRVLIHYAQTLDGRIATRSGSSQWISGPPALRFAHELRAAHDAVLVGVGTVLQDNPHLTVRHAEGPDPLKVVLDSRLRTPDSCALLSETPRRTIFLTTPAADPSDIRRIVTLGGRVLVARADAAGQVDLADVGHQRRMCAVGVEEHAAGVAEAGPDVQLYESRLARRTGVGVRHADRHALVQAEDELELGVVLQQVHEGLLGGAGVAEEVAMPVGLQLLEQRLLATHARHVVLLTSESSGL